MNGAGIPPKASKGQKCKSIARQHTHLKGFKWLKYQLTLVLQELNEKLVEGAAIVDEGDHSGEVVERDDHIFGVPVNVDHLCEKE